MPKAPLIICITGMPGAGKTTVAEVLRSEGFKIISMGDVVREEAKRQGFSSADLALGRIMRRLRRELGAGAIAYLIAQKIKEERSTARRFAVDGLRSIPEVEELRKHGTVKILAIHAPKEARLGFLRKRKRSDAPASEEEFDVRDKRELDVGIGEAISLSDSVIMNDGTIQDLRKRALEVVGRWEKEGRK